MLYHFLPFGQSLIMAAAEEAGFVPADIPQAEADELIELYNSTDGANWSTNTNWTVDTTVDNWHGITVAGGQVTQILLNNNGLNGSVADFDPSVFTALKDINFGDNANVSGSLASWSWPSTMEDIYLDNTAVSGDVSGWTFGNSVSRLYLNNNSLSGSVATWNVRAAMTRIYTNDTSLSGAFNLSNAVAIRIFNFHNCSLSEADVDGNLQAVYDRRASFNYATPSMNVGGTNTTPSGTYQDGDPPTTGLEYAYEIANDPETEGFNTWSVTWNGGSAP